MAVRGCTARSPAMSIRSCATVCIALFALSAAAQSPRPTSLDPIAVTASRTPQPIADLLADLTVIGSDEILRSGVQSIAELLQRQPGVEITMNGGPGSTSGAFIRGANRGQTLVLVDGLRVG